MTDPANQTSHWLKELPNQLTLFRMAVAPVLLLLVPLDVYALDLFCAALFALAAMTDWLDGFLARNFAAESKLGALLDPIADKILTGAALVSLAGSQRLWAWMAGALICRELALSGMRLVAAQQNISIPVSMMGKWKTLFLDVAVVCLMVNSPLFSWPFQEVGMVSLWAAFILSMYSAWDYGARFWEDVNKV